MAAAIFQARPDEHSICHVNSDSVMVIGGIDTGRQLLSQAAFFYGKISLEGYDFTGENSFEDGLGLCDGHRARSLNHHGVYGFGRDAADWILIEEHRVRPVTCKSRHSKWQVTKSNSKTCSPQIF